MADIPNRLTGWYLRSGFSLLVAALVAVPVSAAQARDGWFGAEKPGARAVNYGAIPPKGEAANPETIYLRISCSKDGRFLDVFVAETSAALKPGRQVRVTMSAKGVKTSVAGRTLANQLAGVPSLQFRISISASVLAAMTPQGTLRLSAGRWREATSLGGIGGQLKTVLRSCQRIGRKAKWTKPDTAGTSA